MKIHYAVITEQGHTFTVVLVKKDFLENKPRAEQTLRWLQERRFKMPTTLLACDTGGTPHAYYGRGDLALILARMPIAALPWQETILQ